MFEAKPRRLFVERPHGPARRWSHGEHGLTRRIVRVTAVVREAPDTVTVALEPDDGRPLACRAGQYLTHVFDVRGEPVKRAYSLSSPEGAPLRFTAKGVPGGRASAYLLDAIKAGERYPILGPSGEFVLGAGTHPLLFVAGGSGITPVISLLETALGREPGRSVQLLYASRREADIIFRARLDALAARHPRLAVVHVLTQPGPGWTGERGRPDAARIAALAQIETAIEAYLCGPAGLMDAAATALAGAGIPAQRIHRERFLAAPRATQARPAQPQEIEFRSSRRRVTQRTGESILDAALREGVALSFSCTVGGCGSCKVRVTAGQVGLSEPNCLSADERAGGFTLACSAYALEPVVIDA